MVSSNGSRSNGIVSAGQRVLASGRTTRDDDAILSFLQPGADKLDAALLYQSLRLCIFPLPEMLKRPIVGSHGWHDASGKESQVRHWFTENPNANIGIALPYSGLTVIDIDVHRGGAETFAQWTQEHGEPPATYTVRTPHGGKQLYYTARPDELEEHAFEQKLGKGVELLRKNYVVAPPSVVDLRLVDKDWNDSNGTDPIQPYTVEHGVPGEFARCPFDWLREVTSLDSIEHQDQVWKHDDWKVEYGEHDNTLTSFGGGLRHYFHLTEREIAAMLEVVAPRFTDHGPDFIPHEIPKVAKSIAKLSGSDIAFTDRGMTIHKRASKPELDPKALYGLLGDWIDAIEPITSTHPAALVAQGLAMVGNMIGARRKGDRAPGFTYEGSRQRTGLYVLLIGPSGQGGKGDSYSRAQEFFADIDKTWKKSLRGVQSGETLITRLAALATDSEEKRIHADHRILVLERELIRLVVHVASRQGNTTTDVLRDLFDDGSASRNTVDTAQDVEGCTVSFIGHTTLGEIEQIPRIDLINGFLARFLCVYTERTRMLPLARVAGLGEDLDEFKDDLADALHFARTIAPSEYEFSRQAYKLWTKIVELQSKESYESETVKTLKKSRMLAITRRVSVIHAVMDQSPKIQVPHLEAAHAMWQYHDDSVDYIFGRQLGNKDAVVILEAIRVSTVGMSRTEIQRDVLKNGRNAAVRANTALDLLMTRKLIRQVPTRRGRQDVDIYIASAND